MAGYAGVMWPMACVVLLTVLSWTDPSSGSNYLFGVGGQSGPHVATTVFLVTWGVVHFWLPLPMLLSAGAIRYRRAWGRKLGIFVGGVLLPMLPLGTLVGAALLMVLYHPATLVAFNDGAE